MIGDIFPAVLERISVIKPLRIKIKIIRMIIKLNKKTNHLNHNYESINNFISQYNFEQCAHLALHCKSTSPNL